MAGRTAATGEDVDWSWRDEAACRRESDGKMFPPVPPSKRLDGPRPRKESAGRRRLRLEAEEAAKSVCAGCAVRDECREFALENPGVAEAGVWGGLTEAERRAEARARKRGRRTD